MLMNKRDWFVKGHANPWDKKVLSLMMISNRFRYRLKWRTYKNQMINQKEEKVEDFKFMIDKNLSKRNKPKW